MNTDQLVRTFIEYYEERGHRRVTGSTLLPPPGDPVLFTTSGMHPLTPYLEGRTHPLGRRLANVQRCLRTTDLDEVGDRTHLTVFEMLGTWSLGDYEGPQSLDWGYGLLTDGFSIDPGLLHVTVLAPPRTDPVAPGRTVPAPGLRPCALGRRRHRGRRAPVQHRPWLRAAPPGA
jgi:alanyl-tRNA synthetase